MDISEQIPEFSAVHLEDSIKAATEACQDWNSNGVNNKVSSDTEILSSTAQPIEDNSLNGLNTSVGSNAFQNLCNLELKVTNPTNSSLMKNDSMIASSQVCDLQPVIPQETVYTTSSSDSETPLSNVSQRCSNLSNIDFKVTDISISSPTKNDMSISKNVGDHSEIPQENTYSRNTSVPDMEVPLPNVSLSCSNLSNINFKVTDISISSPIKNDMSISKNVDDHSEIPQENTYFRNTSVPEMEVPLPNVSLSCSNISNIDFKVTDISISSPTKNDMSVSKNVDDVSEIPQENTYSRNTSVPEMEVPLPNVSLSCNLSNIDFKVTDISISTPTKNDMSVSKNVDDVSEIPQENTYSRNTSVPEMEVPLPNVSLSSISLSNIDLTLTSPMNASPIRNETMNFSKAANLSIILEESIHSAGGSFTDKTPTACDNSFSSSHFISKNRCTDPTSSSFSLSDDMAVSGRANEAHIICTEELFDNSEVSMGKGQSLCQPDDSSASIGMESTLGIRKIFNSTLNGSLRSSSNIDAPADANSSLDISSINLSLGGVSCLPLTESFIQQVSEVSQLSSKSTLDQRKMLIQTVTELVPTETRDVSFSCKTSESLKVTNSNNSIESAVDDNKSISVSESSIHQISGRDSGDCENIPELNSSKNLLGSFNINTTDPLSENCTLSTSVGFSNDSNSVPEDVSLISLVERKDNTELFSINKQSEGDRQELVNIEITTDEEAVGKQYIEQVQPEIKEIEIQDKHSLSFENCSTNNINSTLSDSSIITGAVGESLTPGIVESHAANLDVKPVVGSDGNESISIKSPTDFDVRSSLEESPTILLPERMEETCVAGSHLFKSQSKAFLDSSGASDLDESSGLVAKSCNVDFYKRLNQSESDKIENTINMDITQIHGTNGNEIHMIDTSEESTSVHDLNRSLDFTCKPERILLEEDTITLSQSVLEASGEPCQDDLIARSKSEGESLKEKRCPEESLLEEISGCAMDYTLSESCREAAIEDITADLTSPINISFQNSFCQEANKLRTSPDLKSTDSNVVTEKLLDVEISSCAIRPSYMNVTTTTSDIRKKLSESVNISMNLGRKIPTEEVMSMKENLFLIMDLLEEENNQFESFKKDCEKEKIQLLAKIEDLQKQVCASSRNEQVAKAEELGISECPENIEWFKKTFLLTDFDLHETKDILSTLKCLNINTEGLVSEDNDRAIKPKKLLNILSLLLTKYTSFTGDYNKLKDVYEHDKAGLVNQIEQMKKHEEEQGSMFLNLKTEFEKLEIALQDSTEQCRMLEQSNQRLKEDLELRTNEVVTLQNDIKTAMETMIILEETEQKKIMQVEKKFNDLEINFSALQKSNDDLIIKLQEKKLAYDEISKLYENIKGEVDGLNISKSVLEEELSDMKNIVKQLETKYKTAEAELKSLENLRSRHASVMELLDNAQSENQTLKSDLESKNEELINLCLTNEETEKELSLLRNNHESLLQSTVPKSEFYLTTVKLEGSLLALKMSEEQCTKEKEHSAKLLQDLDDKESLCNELRILADGLEEEKSSLKDELAESKANCEKLEEERTSLRAKLAEVEEGLSKQETEYLALKNLHQNSTQSLQSDLNQRNSEYEELRNLNQKLECEMTRLNLELDDWRKHADEREIKIRNECNLLKDEVDEQRNLLNKKNSELASLKTVHQRVTTDLVISKLMLNSSLDSNLILRTEFKQLLSQFGDINIKYKLLDSSHSQLQEKFNKMQLSFEEIQGNYKEKEECNDKFRNEMLSLNSTLFQLREKLSELETRYDSLTLNLNQRNSEYEELRNLNQKLECEITRLNLELDDCRTHVDEREIKIRNECNLLKDEVDEQRNLLNKKNSELASLKTVHQRVTTDLVISNLMLNSSLDSNFILRTEFKQLLSQFGDINLKYKLVDSSHSQLQEKFNKMQLSFEEIQGNYKEKEECNDKYRNEILSLNSTLFQLRDKLSELETRYDSLTANYQAQSAELLLSNSRLDEIKVKYNEHLKQFDELENQFSEEAKTSNRLRQELADRDRYLNETREEILNLKNDYKDLELNYKIESSKLQALNNVHSSFIEKYNCVQSKLSTVETDYENLVVKHEAECSQVLSELNIKYEETQSNLEIIQKQCMEKNDKNEELLNDLRLLKLELAEGNEKYRELKTQYDTLRQDLETEILKSQTLKTTLCNLEAKGFDESSRLKKLQDDFIAKVSENNIVEEKCKELTEVIGSLRNTLEKTKEELDMVKEQHKSLIQESTFAKNELKTLNDEKQKHYNVESELKARNKELETDLLRKSEEAAHWEKESKALRTEKARYEKDYQSAVDSLHETREQMCKMERNIEEKMARFMFVLKEKENFENKTLSLLKQNDELKSKVKELTVKSLEFEKSHSKLQELQSCYSTLSEEKVLLQKQLSEVENFKRENMDLKAELAIKDSQINDLRTDCKQLKNNCQQKADEMKELLDGLFSLLPNSKSSSDILNSIQQTLSRVNTLEKELSEERTKFADLDEECELLNKDVQFKEKVLGDLYKQHMDETNALKESLKKTEIECKEYSEKNKTLISTVEKLEAEIINIKTSEPAPCTGCMELKKTLQRSKLDIVARDSNIASLQQDLEQCQSLLKKKVQEYRKKVGSLQEELGAALNKIEEAKKGPCQNSAVQTDPTPLQLTGQGGIVHVIKIKEQEEKIQKVEKENSVLRRVCQNRLQTIKELQGKLETMPQASVKKTQRNVLEEIQNN